MNKKALSLQDLKRLNAELAAARAEQAEMAQKRAQSTRRAHADHLLFEQAMQGVKPIEATHRVVRQPPVPEPIPRQRQRDDAAVLRESLSDEFDTTTLLYTDGYLSFRRPGIGPDIPPKLRRGHWTIQAQIDLHGLRTDGAREALAAFLRDAQVRGLRCVRVVHGKGLGSPGHVPVLKSKVHGWLIQKKCVLAFTQARPEQGGAGALLVLLAPSK